MHTQQADKLENVYDEKYIKDESGLDNTKVYAMLHQGQNQFILRGATAQSKATVLCRTTPISDSMDDDDHLGTNEEKNLTTGIKTLNLLLDPSKAPERERKAKEAKEKYHQHFDQMDVPKSYKNLFELFWYTKLPCFDVQDVTSKTEEETTSLIKRCSWKGETIDCAAIFVTRPTDRGMCCAFNIEEAEKMFNAKIYANVTSSLQTFDRENSFGTKTLPDW